MRELLVKVLSSLTESHPYLLAAAALIGFFWLARSFIHKARMITQQLTEQLRAGKAELSEWVDEDLRELWRELTKWKMHG